MFRTNQTDSDQDLSDSSSVTPRPLRSSSITKRVVTQVRKWSKTARKRPPTLASKTSASTFTDKTPMQTSSYLSCTSSRPPSGAYSDNSDDPPFPTPRLAPILSPTRTAFSPDLHTVSRSHTPFSHITSATPTLPGMFTKPLLSEMTSTTSSIKLTVKQGRGMLPSHNYGDIWVAIDIQGNIDIASHHWRENQQSHFNQPAQPLAVVVVIDTR